MDACLNCGLVHEGKIMKEHWEISHMYNHGYPHNVGIEYIVRCPRCNHKRPLCIKILYSESMMDKGWHKSEKVIWEIPHGIHGNENVDPETIIPGFKTDELLKPLPKRGMQK